MFRVIIVAVAVLSLSFVSMAADNTAGANDPSNQAAPAGLATGAAPGGAMPSNKGGGRLVMQEVNVEDLPAAVTEAIKAAYPNATIKSVTKRIARDTTFIVVLTIGEATTSATVTPAGQIASARTIVKAADLPKAISDAVMAAAPECTITNTFKTEVFVDKSGKLGKPRVSYDVRLTTKDGTTGGMLMAPDGKVMHPFQKSQPGTPPVPATTLAPAPAPAQ